MEIKVCKCGSTPEVVKIFERGRPDCFIRCPDCGSETKCYTSRQNAIKAWNAGRLYIGETAELVERLNTRAMVGRMEVRDKQLMLKAAEMLEDLRQDVDEWIACFDMLNDRENRHKYLDYWREKNGKDELWYPDGDEVYKDFFEMKARVEEYEKVVGKLAVKDGEVVGILCGKETSYVDANVAKVMKELAVRSAVEDLVEKINERVAVATLEGKSEDYADGYCDAVGWYDEKVELAVKDFWDERKDQSNG